MSWYVNTYIHVCFCQELINIIINYEFLQQVRLIHYFHLIMAKCLVIFLKLLQVEIMNLKVTQDLGIAPVKRLEKKL